VNESSAVDIECFENLNHGFFGLIGLLGPGDDVEVFFAVLEARNNTIEQFSVDSELTLEESEVATVEFGPKAGSLKMLEPAVPKKAPPMLADPAVNRPFAQIAACPFAFNPFVAISFCLTFLVDAAHVVRTWATLANRSWYE
jgi:hypothetical protein